MSAGQGSHGSTKVIYRNGSGDIVVKPGGEIEVESGGSIDVESGASLKLAGTALSASAAELNQYSVECVIPDISTAGSFFVTAPHAGDIAIWYSTIDNAITVGDATLTLEIGGTLVTGSSITVAQSGSAAGDVDSASPSAANTVTAGQAIEVITDGGSTTACRATVTIVITR